MNWNAIKSEYITTDTSYRKLSRKYGLSATAIGNRARAEGWCSLREEYLNDSYTKTIESSLDDEVERRTRILKVSDKLLTAIEAVVDKITSEELILEKGALKAISGAIRDIKDIQNLKSPLDLEEQRARIDNLRRQSGEDADGTISVSFEEDVEAMSG